MWVKTNKSKSKIRPIKDQRLFTACFVITVHGQKEDHLYYDVRIFLCLEIKLKSQLLRIFHLTSFNANSKTIYKIRINNL